MEKPRIIMTVGAPASGKTTWASEFCLDNRNFINLNRDDIRKHIQIGSVYKYSKQREKLVTQWQLLMAEEAVSKGYGVVISDTNLNETTRSVWEIFAKNYEMDLEYKIFDEPVHVLLQRNLMRSESVPVDVIYRMARQMREFLGKPVYDAEKMKIVEAPTWREIIPYGVIFDMDGTLADNNHRKPFDYDNAINDKPNLYLLNLLNYHVSQGYNIIILTGREADEDGKVNSTLEWLDKYGVHYDHIWSRAHKDHRSDAIIKEELFFKHIADNFIIDCVYDDRKQVVDMWRSIGVTCYQVAEGEF